MSEYKADHSWILPNWLAFQECKEGHTREHFKKYENKQTW